MRITLRSLDLSIEFFVTIILSFSLSYYIPVFMNRRCPNLMSPEDIFGYHHALQATAATIAISIPLLLESLMDINLPKEITISRWMHIIGLIIPNLIVMIKPNSEIYVSSGLARGSMLIGSLMLHMFNDLKLFTKSRKIKYFFIYLNIQICFQYRLYRLHSSPQSSSLLMILEPFIYGLGLITILFFAIIICQMFLFDEAYDGGNKYCVYYSVCGFLALIVFTVCAIIVINKDATKTSYLAGYNLVTTLCVESAISVFATVIPTRIARHDRDQAEVSSLTLPSPMSFTLLLTIPTAPI
jgi:hypothetical protein